jgi:hypothetical protein
MMRPLTSRLIAAALAVAALGAATAAQARPDIHVSIGLPGLPGLPVFVQPPVYVRSAPVYVQPPAVYGPPVVVYRRPWVPAYRGDFDRDRAWRYREWQRHEWERREWERREWRHRDHHWHHSHGRDRD